MQRVQREDYAWMPLSLPVETGGGFLRVEGYATRSGVFEYLKEDGSVSREWRPPEEVADATSIDSMKMVPVTLGHPDEPVTIDNASKYRVGTVGDGVSTESEWKRAIVGDGEAHSVKVRVSMVIDSKDAIKILRDKTMTQLSCGYSADIEETSGITPLGESYDRIQRNIRQNHLAIVDQGRAGPGIEIRVDQKDGAKKMEKLILDGVSFDAPKQTIEAVNAHTAKLRARVDELDASIAASKKAIDTAEAKADAANEATKKAQASEAAMQERLKTMLKDRRALERSAASVLGDAIAELNLDEIDDKDLRLAVIKHASPDIVLDEKSDDYINARFDILVESAGRTDSAEDKKDSKDAKPSPQAGFKNAMLAKKTDATDEAQAKWMKRRQDAWKPKV